MAQLHRPLRALVVGIVVSACGASLLGPEELPEHLRAPELSVASWEVVDGDGFSFRLPPGFEKTDAVPIDSDAAGYARDGDHLLYDYGAYSGPWRASPNEPVSEITEFRVRLGGRPAQLVSYRLDGYYVVRAWWGSVGRSSLGELDLVVRGESDTRSGRTELLAVIHSVRFD